jgi:D-alanyl-lipoteichoic acid acyltransferase DltB (MBOAT superfamily)
MLFNSVQYAVFFAIVLTAFWALPQRWKRHLLLVASYVFYGWWDWKLLALLAFTTASTYVGGRVLARPQARLQRRILLAYSLLAPLGTLVAFKAYGFFVSDLQDGSAAFGLQVVGPSVELIVPIGLSFYTFQSVSYVIDVYRDDQRAITSPIDYALFVSFFPQLLAGPILRARQLVPQLQNLPTRARPTRVVEGCELLVTGLFKKVVLADTLATSGSDVLTSGVIGGERLTTVVGLLGMASAFLANFFDIAGYTDMARGSAKLLGIDMQPNFVQPLTRSRNFQDFWRRWQITIMGWFRDYVFAPLRGRRPSAAREAFALIGTFIVVALWHSGRPTWLIWGVLVASVLIVETAVRRRLVERRRARARRSAAGSGTSPGRTPTRRLLGLAYTWMVLLLTSVWLGAPNVQTALDSYQAILHPSIGALDPDAIVVLTVGVLALVLLDRRERVAYRLEGTWDPPGTARILAVGVMVVAVVLFSGSPVQPFIYLQF